VAAAVDCYFMCQVRCGALGSLATLLMAGEKRIGIASLLQSIPDGRGFACGLSTSRHTCSAGSCLPAPSAADLSLLPACWLVEADCTLKRH
jgi:hypothetical protein